MPTRRSLLALAAFTMASQLTGAPPSQAAGIQAAPYKSEAFTAAQKAGKSILIKITAPWCPTCKAQKPILDELTSAEKFKNLAIFEIDFDSQPDLVAAFKARMQSTLITYKGERETGRSVGETSKAAIGGLLDKAI